MGGLPLPLLVPLMLLTWLYVGVGQNMDEPPGDPNDYCEWDGEWHLADPTAPIRVYGARCFSIFCVMRSGIARIAVNMTGEDDATNCCEFDGKLYLQGEVEYHGNCINRICTDEGWTIDSVLSPGDEVPCAPGSTSVWSGNRRRCITVIPTTSNFSVARVLCRRLLGRDLVRPFGQQGRRDDRLREALGRVRGWLRARGRGGRPRWPGNHPDRLWYDGEPVPRSEATGCLGYRHTSDSSGWYEYPCSDTLLPICAARPPRSCRVETCFFNGSRREHGSLLSRRGPCLSLFCWHGQRMLEPNPACCERSEQNGTTISLLPEGTHNLGSSICTCEMAELSCVDRLTNCTEADPP